MDSNNVDFTIFRNNLYQLAKAHGMSLRQLGFAIGIPNPTLSRYVTGSRNPELIYVIKIADYFGVTIEWLLGIKTRECRKYNEEHQRLIDLYSVASEQDKELILKLLSRYERV